MLIEIQSPVFKCSNIKDGLIKFHPGLNTLIGNANSIGKSLLLFAIDFAYGGDDYLNIDPSVTKNVGDHSIFFIHKFNGIKHKYSRSTNDPNIVIEYSNDNISKKWNIEQFRKYLQLNLNDSSLLLSFREAIGPFTRILLKNTFSVTTPMQAYKGQNLSSQVDTLLKIYHIYELFKSEKDELKFKKEDLSKFKGAREIKLIETIDKNTKAQYLARINELTILKQNIKEKHKKGIVTLDDVQLDELKELERQLKILKRKRTYTKINIDNISIDMDDLNKSTTANYKELKYFFPNEEFKELDDVIQYSKKLAKITKNEKESSINELNENLKMLNENILSIENEIKKIVPEKSAPADILDQYSKIDAEIKSKQNAINKELEFEQYVINEKNAQKNYDLKLETIIPAFEDKINQNLKEENDMFFREQTSPELTISKTALSYNLKVINDTGNASTTRGLIMFDMLALKNTAIPYVIHDGMITNSLVTENTIKIMNYYQSCASVIGEKQIFVCMEKGDTYSGNLKNLIEKYSIIKLSKGKESLY